MSSSQSLHRARAHITPVSSLIDRLPIINLNPTNILQMSIIFTTGATVTFRSLVDEVVDPSFLDSVVSAGFTKVSLQYGNETDQTGRNISKEYFSERLAAEKTIEHFDFDLTNETNDKAVTTFKNKTLTFEVFAFSDDISKHISAADLVVSHAGTGLILDTLRLHKPLIVVTNDSLMDLHQAEIATRFQDEGYLARVSESELKNGGLRTQITEWKRGNLKFNTLPDPPAGVLEHLIATELQKV